MSSTAASAPKVRGDSACARRRKAPWRRRCIHRASGGRGVRRERGAADARADVVISSKIGIPLSAKPNDGGLGRKRLMAAIDGGHQRLGAEDVDIFHIHRLDGVTPPEETLEAFADIIRAGKARSFGVSTMPAWRMAQITTRARAKGYRAIRRPSPCRTSTT